MDSCLVDLPQTRPMPPPPRVNDVMGPMEEGDVCMLFGRWSVGDHVCSGSGSGSVLVSGIVPIVYSVDLTLVVIRYIPKI